MALTGQDLLKARNVRVAAGYDDSVGLTLHVVDGPLWRAAYGRASAGTPLIPPSIASVSPVGQGATDIAALNALFAAMISSTAATAAAESAQSTAAAAIAAAVAAAAA
jgi:hypothetical protein